LSNIPGRRLGVW